MKNTIYKISVAALSLAALVTLNSCWSLLDQANPNAEEVEDFWDSSSDILQGLASTYGVMQYAEVMGGPESSYGSARGDLARSGKFDTSTISVQNFTYNNSNNYIVKKWNRLYTGIFRANQVLDHLPSIEPMDEELRATVEGEAHFLRGLYYFWLMNTYNKGQLPIHTSVPQSLDEYSAPLSPKADVKALIIADFERAIELLPEQWDGDNKGRATWGAAVGFLGQLYLYEGEYAMAAKMFKQIIDRSDLYALTEEIGWNFGKEHEWNSESIFEVNFSDNVQNGNSGYVVDSAVASEATTRAIGWAPANAGGFTSIQVSAWARKIFMEDEVDTSLAGQQTRRYSKRCEASIYFESCGYEFYKLANNATDFSFVGVSSRAFVKKFQNWEGNQKEDVVDKRSGINERLMRLADVYLMYAESMLLSRGDIATAIKYIDKVRLRAGVVTLSKRIASGKAADYDSVEEIMNHLKYVERPLELAFEGHSLRWHDLRRWGNLKEWFTELDNMEFHFQLAGGQDWYVTKTYSLSAQNFSDENYYFPLPSEEVNNNSNI